MLSSNDLWTANYFGDDQDAWYIQRLWCEAMDVEPETPLSESDMERADDALTAALAQFARMPRNEHGAIVDDDDFEILPVDHTRTTRR